MYRSKTYVAFASEDIHYYRLMEAWRDNDHIDFHFVDAHDLNTALDTSKPDTIRRRLRERLVNTKQVVFLVSKDAKAKAGRPSSFLYYEVETVAALGLPIVFANLNGVRTTQDSLIPSKLGEPLYTMSTSFQPAVIKYALDNYVAEFAANLKATTPKTGAYYYKPAVYQRLGL